MDKPLACIEISSTGVRLLIGYEISGQPVVLYSKEENGDFINPDGTIKDADALIAALSKFHEIHDENAKWNINVKEVCLILPSCGLNVFTSKKTSTVVYYQDNYGYLVPVMCSVPMADGIAKATLSMMVQSPDNDMQAARLGLRTVLPENTTIDLDIANGLARIDLGKEVLDMADAAAESNMVDAIVQTLTEFDTVDRVEFLIGGQKREKLTHGTDVSKVFTRGDINVESMEPAMSVAEAKPVMLYFPADSGTVIVPVTRMVQSGADINTAVLELAKGPVGDEMLESVVPAGCGLIDVKVEDGVAKLNFTGEFVNLVQNSDGGRMALKALVLTCTQFDGVDSVEIYVDGQKYDAAQGELGVPSFMNIADSIVYDSIQTQADVIFDIE